jgi:hypothetical protein
MCQPGGCVVPRFIIYVHLNELHIPLAPDVSVSGYQTSQITADLFRNDTLPPKLMLHGQTVESYNDGAYYIETLSTTRPTEWVKRDKYPRASVEVRQPQWEKLIPFASAKEKDIPATF